jgi:orotate phosphoribosyltransferase-like protein
MARPQLSTNQKVRNLIEKGMTTKQIVKALHVSPQVVYNTRHRLNRKQGIGGLPVSSKEGTGITIEQIRATSARLKAERTCAKKSLWQRIVGIFA